MTATDVRFAEENEPQLEEYRPLSGLAVAGLILGLLAPLGLTSAYLLPIPAAGVAVSLAALWRVAANSDGVSGRRLAMAGLALSLFFGAWAITQTGVRYWAAAAQARRFCDGWLELVQEGKYAEAYDWTFAPEERAPAAVPLDEHYEQNTEAKQGLRQFFAGTPLAPGEDNGRFRDFRYLGNQSVVLDARDGSDSIEHRYEIIYETEGELQRETILLNVLRLPHREEDAVHWRLQSLRMAP